MIDMHVGDNQRANGGQIEIDAQAVTRRAPRCGFLRTLKEATIDQQAEIVSQPQLVAGAGDAIDGAVVNDLHDSSLSVEQHRDLSA